MIARSSRTPARILALVAAVLIVRVTASVVSNYSHYYPPDFSFDFLRGREGHFHGLYEWAFYTHILSGPISLILGLALVGEWPRRRFPAWHRRMGWVQVAGVLFLVTPSGLVMAWWAAAGPVAAVGLASLALATAACTALGAWTASRRRFADHRRWMWRSYLLLCSAVVLRLIGGLGTVLGVTAPWYDPLATWVCWLLPLSMFELRERLTRWRRGGSRPAPATIPPSLARHFR